MATQRKRWAKGSCSCGLGRGKWVHAADCPLQNEETNNYNYGIFEDESKGLFPWAFGQDAPADPILPGSILSPTKTGFPVLTAAPVRKRKRNSPPGNMRAMPNYAITLQFYFTRPINIDLWKLIKAPPGWRKCPITKNAQNVWCGVRFRCNDYKQQLTTEELEFLHAKLLMSLSTLI